MTAFSEQVLTNSRYFWRLSKNRKFLVCGPVAAGGLPAGRAVAAGGIRNGRSPGWPEAGALAMYERTRSKVVVVIRPPSRRRLTNLPSFTASRPNVDSATPVRRQ